MPRDCTPHAAGEVDLAAGRKGRIVSTIVAGAYRIEVIGADWLSRLAGAGVLDRDQVEAAQLVALLFETSGVRPHLATGYEPAVDGAPGDDFLERLTGKQLHAWRRLHRLLGSCPPHTRSMVEQVACWDRPPTSVKQLQQGLDAVARAIRQPRRR